MIFLLNCAFFALPVLEIGIYSLMVFELSTDSLLNGMIYLSGDCLVDAPSPATTDTPPPLLHTDMLMPIASHHVKAGCAVFSAFQTVHERTSYTCYLCQKL